MTKEKQQSSAMHKAIALPLSSVHRITCRSTCRFVAMGAMATVETMGLMTRQWWREGFVPIGGLEPICLVFCRRRGEEKQKRRKYSHGGLT